MATKKRPEVEGQEQGTQTRKRTPQASPAMQTAQAEASPLIGAGGVGQPTMAAPSPEVLMAMSRAQQGAGGQGMGMSVPGMQQQTPGVMQPGMERSPQPFNGTGAVEPDIIGRAPHEAMTEARLKEAEQVFLRYKAGKASVDARIIAAQQWWKLRNWEQIEAERGTQGTQKRKSNTAWLWNCIVGKHADYMEAYPEPLFLARNQEDEAEAQHLSEIIPVVLAQNNFEETYSACGWQKVTEGTGVYGVFWDGQDLNGVGDVVVRKINALNIFPEPGVEDIQDSANVFLVQEVENDRLIAQYPQLEGRLGVNNTLVNEYRHDDEQRKQNASLVFDWYYKKWVGPRQVLHYCKFVGLNVLYSSEDDPACAQVGYYADGEYPFVPDAMYPVADSIWGIGMIDVGKDTQADIDTISQALVTNAVVSATPRYVTRKNGGINEQELMDLSKAVVHADGNLGADSFVPVEVPQMPSNALNMYQAKIEELKFVTGNTDVQNGAVPTGVTSGVAIAALKEDAGRSSKDSARTSYRAMKRLFLMVVERMRQFYSIGRQFRIVGENGMARYIQYSNQRLVLQTQMGIDSQPSYRLPQFDVDVHVQRENAYTRMSLNDLATQFYQMGVFNPMMAPQALMMLSMMEFKGKETIVQKVQQGGMVAMLPQMMAGMDGTQQPSGGGDKPMQPQATEEYATESGKKKEQSDAANTPATDRMRQRVNEAVRPE